jgi:hypothetical protein
MTRVVMTGRRMKIAVISITPTLIITGITELKRGIVGRAARPTKDRLTLLMTVAKIRARFGRLPCGFSFRSYS